MTTAPTANATCGRRATRSRGPCHAGAILPPGPTARLAVPLAALALAGCGSRPASELPPAATAAPAAAAATPAGRVVRIGGEPRGIVADAETGTVAIALGDAVALADAGTGAIRRRVEGLRPRRAAARRARRPGAGARRTAWPRSRSPVARSRRARRAGTRATPSWPAAARSWPTRRTTRCACCPTERVATALEPARLASADDGRQVAVAGRARARAGAVRHDDAPARRARRRGRRPGGPRLRRREPPLRRRRQAQRAARLLDPPRAAAHPPLHAARRPDRDRLRPRAPADVGDARRDQRARRAARRRPADRAPPLPDRPQTRGVSPSTRAPAACTSRAPTGSFSSSTRRRCAAPGRRRPRRRTARR